MKSFLAYLLFLFSFQLLVGQEALPKDYFLVPLEIPLQLSGTFGELRNNHFHSGLDIRTQQKEGFPIYAAADGYVSRIKVAHFGYGKALYIQHPNGYSTVYAHLQSYAGAIEDYVKKTQYQRESYEIEVFPDAELLPVKKGELIAYSGNTGGSGGPHLHFEIRDQDSRPMNPLLFGIPIADHKKPIVHAVYAYPENDAHVNQDQNPQRIRLILQRDGNYIAEKIKAHGKLGFAIATNDRQDAAPNQNGVYKIETTYNGTPTLSVVFDKFSFAETRYINRFIDYRHWKANKRKLQKLYIEDNNPLHIFKSHEQRGYINVEPGLDAVFTIEVFDAAGNSTLITIPIEGTDLPVLTQKEVETHPYQVYVGEGTSIKEGKFSIYIPPKSLYENTTLNISAEDNTLHFHEDDTPIHSNITITADVSNFKDVDIDKVYIGRWMGWGTPYYVKTTRAGNKLSAKVRTFGDYKLVVDTIAPTIIPLNFSDGRWISNNETLEVKVEDEHSGVKSYRATLNGKWILMEYEYKKDLLTFDFSNNIVTDTEYNLKLIVTDNVGNSSVYEATFFRK